MEGVSTFVFPDRKLIEMIQFEFPSDMIILEEVTLTGFEIYLVEQWLSDRKLSTSITTYTGSSKDVIAAIRVTVLVTDQLLWPLSLRVYISELVESQKCRPKDTESGVIYVTNISQFPSNLNLIEVEKGDVKDVWEMFIVNSNLKKMGCSGRSVLTLSKPTSSMDRKFRQTFKIHPDVEVSFAARELVLIVQTFLYYYNLFPATYCDGTLCDQTEDAVQSWWDTIGTKYYETRQKKLEGLSSVSVCAIIAFTLNLKMRLELLNTSSIVVPKDPLSVERFRLAVGQFQKHSLKNSSLPQSTATAATSISGITHHVSEENTYFFDQVTVENIMIFSNHKMNSQQFKTDFNKVKKMLKNTVSDISSGRTYLNLSSSSGGLLKNSANVDLYDLENLNDLLTLDIEKMINFIQGKRLVYLWRGKGTAVNIEQVSLAHSIREQLARHRRHTEKSLSTQGSQPIHNNGDYLSLPVIEITQSGSSKNSDRKNFGSATSKSSISGSTSGIEIYDTEGSDSTNDKLYPSSTGYSGLSDDLRTRKSSATSEQWLIDDNNKVFESQLKRRASFPSMNKELNSSLLLHQQDYLFEENSQIDRHFANINLIDSQKDLKRSNSFSTVETATLRWEYPFTPSIYKLSLDYLSMKGELEFNFRTASDDLNEFIQRIEQYVDLDESKDYNPFSSNSKKHGRRVDSKLVDELYNRVTSRSEFLELKLKDIDLLNSRLSYELRVLTNKVKDVEDNLRQLQDFKLKKVIENLALYQTQRPELKERLLKYRELQRTLLDATDAIDESDKEDDLKLTNTPLDHNGFILVVTLYFIALWHEILRILGISQTLEKKVDTSPE